MSPFIRNINWQLYPFCHGQNMLPLTLAIHLVGCALLCNTQTLDNGNALVPGNWSTVDQEAYEVKNNPRRFNIGAILRFVNLTTRF